MCLAWCLLAHPQYFFRVLDISHKGFLTRFNINFFFREIMARMPNQEPVAVADVCVRAALDLRQQ